MLIPTMWLAAAISTLPGGPARQPQVAAAHGVVAVTFGAGSSIYYAASKDGGETFAPPVKVADGGTLMLGRHRGPRLAILKDALVITAMVSEKAGAADLTVWRSEDRGRTWQRTGIVNDVPAATHEGLHAMAATPDGTLYAVWLDLRVKGTQLYGARSADGGRTWSPNYKVYSSPSGTICTCCHPTLAVDAQGAVHVMWRNAVDGSRDMWIAGASGEDAKKVGAGTWKLEACPMDGGGVAFDGRTAVTVWRREGALFLTRGEGPEEPVGLGKDPAIALTPRGTFLAWTTKDGGIAVRTPGAEPRAVAPEGGYASLAALPDGSVLAAWETKAGLGFERLRRVRAGHRRWAYRRRRVRPDAEALGWFVRGEEMP